MIGGKRLFRQKPIGFESDKQHRGGGARTFAVHLVGGGESKTVGLEFVIYVIYVHRAFARKIIHQFEARVNVRVNLVRLIINLPVKKNKFGIHKKFSLLFLYVKAILLYHNLTPMSIIMQSAERSGGKNEK